MIIYCEQSSRTTRVLISEINSDQYQLFLDTHICVWVCQMPLNTIVVWISYGYIKKHILKANMSFGNLNKN